MPEHPANNRLTTTAQRSGLDDDPLRKGSRHVVLEPADLLFLSAQQPALTILWRVSLDKRAVLIWHGTTLATLYELM